jgi:hypothetical protein
MSPATLTAFSANGARLTSFLGTNTAHPEASEAASTIDRIVAVAFMA